MIDFYQIEMIVFYQMKKLDFYQMKRIDFYQMKRINFYQIERIDFYQMKMIDTSSIYLYFIVKLCICENTQFFCKNDILLYTSFYMKFY